MRCHPSGERKAPRTGSARKCTERRKQTPYKGEFVHSFSPCQTASQVIICIFYCVASVERHQLAMGLTVAKPTSTRWCCCPFPRSLLETKMTLRGRFRDVSVFPRESSIAPSSLGRSRCARTTQVKALHLAARDRRVLARWQLPFRHAGGRSFPWQVSS